MFNVYFCKMISMNKSNLLKPLNLLYVEDDIDTLTSFSFTLECIVDNLYTATDGQKALDILNKNAIDIIVTDLNMPNMDGIELTTHIRKLNKNLPIVFLTAYSDLEYMLEAIEQRIIKYLIKPITVDKLISVLENIASDIYEYKSVILLANGIKIDLDKNIIIDQNLKKSLTSNELIFLKTLNNNNNSLVSEDTLLLKIWEDEAYARKESLYSLVTKLRKKIGKESILNISKIGYKLN